ncbi:MAG: DNA cytosine methyltransferase [Defluviitaleaceae bacterium]|nr:DNA cytosine methyltransferase [Defluviitaleaceae bacterium]
MLNTIDLFAGCGGLTEGFKQQSGQYNLIACVEWDKVACDALRHRLKTKWKLECADKRVLRFDIQRTDELLNGWNDSEYGSSEGLEALVAGYGGNVDVIVGGPPCQSYSVAGRVRDENGMRDDYRNYLFEHYIEIVKHYRPKAIVFENVPGMLSARPGENGEKIAARIQQEFADAGYALLDDFNNAIIDFTEYGVPQNRKRIILFGLRSELFGGNAKEVVNRFYVEILPKYKKTKKATVREAIGDLPKLFPLEEPIKHSGKRLSHSLSDDENVLNHMARYNSHREIDIFRLLTNDIESGTYEYTSIDSLKKLYTKITGRKSNIHKYYVLRWDEPSNTIPAHLYKDGLRHIHPDHSQARSITVREAARLQTFPDDFEFISNTALDFKIIGNAVPPMFSAILAKAILEILC